MPCYQEITCPRCQSNHITQSGGNAKGEQRYRCQNPNCQMKTFMRVYCYTACQPMIDRQMTKLAINGSGVRDTASVLGINKHTVIRRLKKKPSVCCKSIQTYHNCWVHVLTLQSNS